MTDREKLEKVLEYVTQMEDSFTNILKIGNMSQKV